MKKFVYLVESIDAKDCFIEENAVGIVEREGKEESTIQFANPSCSLTLPNDILIEFDYKKTGDQYAKKICNVCNRLLPTEFFEKNQNGINNRTVRRPSCNDCRAEIDGAKLSSADKRRMERVKPNEEIWECPICEKITIPGVTSKVVLDHDHITGKPRAWICDSCNTGLGRFKDDVGIMENAIRYLKKFNEKKD